MNDNIDFENLKNKPQKRTIKVTKEISSCVECPYIGIDGGPGSCYTCNYPGREDFKTDLGYIIDRDVIERKIDFPLKCPLLKK